MGPLAAGMSEQLAWDFAAALGYAAVIFSEGAGQLAHKIAAGLAGAQIAA